MNDTRKINIAPLEQAEPFPIQTEVTVQHLIDALQALTPEEKAYSVQCLEVCPYYGNVTESSANSIILDDRFKALSLDSDWSQ